MKYPDRDSTLEVVSFDLSGKEVKRSKTHTWNDTRAEKLPTLEPAMVYWLRPDKLVICGGASGIYDRERDKLILLEKVEPWLYGNTPMRPDGKLFLAEETEGQKRLALVDWDGKIQPIDWAIPEGDRAHPHVELIWDKHVARLVSAEATWLVDTEKKTVQELAEGAPDVIKGEGDLQSMHTFPVGGYRVCVFATKENVDGKETEYHRIELQNPADRKQKVLVKKAEGVFTLFPSPDRKKVAIRYTKSDEKKERILILDDKGASVADFEIKE